MKKPSISPLRFGQKQLIEKVEPKTKFHVTVCIASIFAGGNILGASDRMMTAGDVEFEPSMAVPTSSKIISLTSSITAMTAGDSGLQAEILQRVFAVLNERIKKEPQNWWFVKDVVGLYRHFYNEIKSERASSVLLAPFGLDGKSFIARQKEMADVFVKQMTGEIVNFEMPQVETIICGIDPSGAHIYKLRNNDYVCCDAVGFACIGIGARHAELKFMSAGHTRFSLLSDTLLLVYTAKKCSEVAPGVGKGTDMFTIGPNLGTFILLKDIPDLDIGKLEKTYQGIVKKELQIQEVAKTQIKEYVEEMLKKRVAATQHAVETTDAGTAVAGGTTVPDDPKKT
jgi:hypothetical protein